MKIGLLAGGHGSRLGLGPKAFVEVAGKPIWRLMVDELSQLSESPVMLVTPEESPQLPGVEQIKSEGKYLSDLLSLTRRKPDREPLLVVNADAVLVTASEISQFVAEVGNCSADFIWPAVERSAIWPERQSPRLINYLPGTNNTLARGHLMYIPGQIKPDVRIIERMNRHKLLADIIALGGVNMLKVITFRLSTKDIERRIGELLGCNACLIPCRYANFAFDVDYPVDLEFAETQFRRHLGR
jgi:GTP:adenosylcobinamide-phosphate guanylyltransferase